MKKCLQNLAQCDIKIYCGPKNFWDYRHFNGVFFWPVPCAPSVLVFSDASANGCSAFIQGTDLVFQRNWSLDESEKSSTWRELAAIKFSIDAFGTRLSKQRVRIVAY